jgi:hypothetical protein
VVVHEPIATIVVFDTIYGLDLFKTKLKFTARSPESPPYPEPEMYAKAALIRPEGLRPGDGRPPTRRIALSAVAIAAVVAVFATGSLVTTHQAHAYWGRGWGLRVLFLIELLLVLLAKNENVNFESRKFE